MSQRNGLSVGLIMAILGTVVLGTDRLTAQADSGSIFGQVISAYTVIGVALLLIAAAWLYFFKSKADSGK